MALLQLWQRRFSESLIIGLKKLSKSLLNIIFSISKDKHIINYKLL